MKLPLDEHLSPELVEVVRSLAPALDIVSIHQWQHGQFTNQQDERILRAAAAEGRVLVTFDLRTIPAILSDLAVCGESHAGLIFVSAKSFVSNNFKSLARALAERTGQAGDDDWCNRVGFLSKS